MNKSTSTTIQDETKTPHKQQPLLVNSDSGTVQQQQQDALQIASGHEMPAATEQNATAVQAAGQGTEPR